MKKILLALVLAALSFDVAVEAAEPIGQVPENEPAALGAPETNPVQPAAEKPAEKAAPRDVARKHRKRRRHHRRHHR